MTKDRHVSYAAFVRSSHPRRYALREELVREHVEDSIGHE